MASSGFCLTPYSPSPTHQPTTIIFCSSIYLVQLFDEVPEVIQAALLDLQQVLVQGNMQELIQPGLLGHQHLHHCAKCLTVLRVKLHGRTTETTSGMSTLVRAREETTTELLVLNLSGQNSFTHYSATILTGTYTLGQH